MEKNISNACRKLKQLRTSFQLQMSAISPAKQLQMQFQPPHSEPEAEEINDRHRLQQEEVPNQGTCEIETDFNKDSKYEFSNEELKTLESILQDFLPQIKLTFEKWGETFGECESFENLYLTRMDEILREAKCLENELILQKETLKGRLKFLTKTLASNLLEEE